MQLDRVLHAAADGCECFDGQGMRTIAFPRSREESSHHLGTPNAVPVEKADYERLRSQALAPG